MARRSNDNEIVIMHGLFEDDGTRRIPSEIQQENSFLQMTRSTELQKTRRLKD
jgi:hypothetical protein